MLYDFLVILVDIISILLDFDFWLRFCYPDPYHEHEMDPDPGVRKETDPYTSGSATKGKVIPFFDQPMRS